MSKKIIKKYRFFIFIAAVFAVSVLAFIFYMDYSFDRKLPKTNPAKENDTALKSEIPFWKVYKSDEYGFALDYPENWTLDVTKREDLTTHSVYFGPAVSGYYPVMINFFKKPREIPLKDWVENNAYFGGTFEKEFVESKGMPSNYYVDGVKVSGRHDGYRVTLLSDMYFIPKVFEGKLDKYYFECKCDYDMESIYFLRGEDIIAVTAIRNMGGQKTRNKLVEKNGRYEVESPDEAYVKSGEIFSKMIESIRFIEE